MAENVCANQGNNQCEKSKYGGWRAGGAGVLIGFVNGLLGAGGGMVAVPLLKWMGLDEKCAHATSIAVIWPLTMISAGLYLWAGHVALGDVAPYVLPGLAGCVAGAWVLKRMAPLLLRRIFGMVLILSALKMLLG